MTQPNEAAVTRAEARPQAPRKAPGKRGSTQEAKKEAARLAADKMLREARLSNRAIARETGLSASTIDRMARAFVPLATGQSQRCEIPSTA
jgi:hypothetical protein